MCPQQLRASGKVDETFSELGSHGTDMATGAGRANADDGVLASTHQVVPCPLRADDAAFRALHPSGTGSACAVNWRSDQPYERTESDVVSNEQGAIHDYYALGLEQARLDGGVGAVEYERTKEIIGRHLPDAPCVVADVGGGPGRYALWLAGLGCSVRHRDLVPLHVEQVAAAAAGRDVETAVCDATRLDLGDHSVDAVLLLGPLYHLQRRHDRLRALGEARRIVRPGGPVFVAAISRWAARIYGVLGDRLYRHFPDVVDELEQVEHSGTLRPLYPGSFTGYGHRPRQLAGEVRSAGLDLVDLVAVEGPGALLGDLPNRMRDSVDAQVVLDTARALERVPELLGIGPHLLATARRPTSTTGVAQKHAL